MARRPHDAPVYRYQLMDRSIITRGGTIVAVFSRLPLRLDQEFGPNRPTLCLATRERLSAANCFDNYANTHELMGYRASLTLR